MLQRCSPPSVLRPAVLIFKFDIIIHYLIFILSSPVQTDMLRLSAHTVACCCAKFETGQTFTYMETDATTPKIVGPTTLGSCCARLHIASRVYNEAT